VIQYNSTYKKRFYSDFIYRFNVRIVAKLIKFSMLYRLCQESAGIEGINYDGIRAVQRPQTRRFAVPYIIRLQPVIVSRLYIMY